MLKREPIFFPSRMDAAARMDGILEVTRAWSMPGRIIYGDYQAEVNLVGLSP